MFLATCGSPVERTSTVTQQLMVAPTLKTTGLHYIISLSLQWTNICLTHVLCFVALLEFHLGKCKCKWNHNVAAV